MFGATWRLNKYISVHFSCGLLVWFLLSGSTDHSTCLHKCMLLSRFGTRRNNSHDSANGMKWGGWLDKQTGTWRKASVLCIWIASRCVTVVSLGKHFQCVCVCYNFVYKTRGQSVIMETSYFSNTLFLIKYYQVLCLVIVILVFPDPVSPSVSVEK